MAEPLRRLASAMSGHEVSSWVVHRPARTAPATHVVGPGLRACPLAEFLRLLP
jgi:hypothetical protein